MFYCNKLGHIKRFCKDWKGKLVEKKTGEGDVGVVSQESGYESSEMLVVGLNQSDNE